MRKIKRNCDYTKTYEIDDSFEIGDDEVCFTVVCDFRYDGDEDDVGYCGHGWVLEGVHTDEIYILDEHQRTDLNIEEIKQYVLSDAFNRTACCTCDDLARQEESDRAEAEYEARMDALEDRYFEE